MRIRSIPLLAGIAALAAATPAAAQDPEPVEPPTIRVLPTISGSPQIGSVLVATPGAWQPKTATPAYQWVRCDAVEPRCAPIPGATGLEHTVVLADAGYRLAIQVVVTKSGDSSAPALSVPTEPVPVPPQPPVIQTPPVISGVARAGELLTATPGTWMGTSPTFSYAWMRCDVHGSACVPLSDSTFAAFRLNAADVGHTLRVSVTASAAGGSSAVVSSPTEVVAAAAGVESPQTEVTPVTATSSASTTGAAPPSLPGATVTPVLLRPVAPALMRPFPVVRVKGHFAGRRTTLTLVRVSASPTARVAMRCRGSSCPFGRRARPAGTGRLRGLERTYVAGTVIEVRVWREGAVGKLVRLRFRAGRPPARDDGCVTSLQARSVPCPAG